MVVCFYRFTTALKRLSNVTINSVSSNSRFSSMNMKKFDLPPRYVGSEANVWTEFIKLSQDYQPINLGQGFPDFLCPDHVIEAFRSVANRDEFHLHQYSRGRGHVRLVNALTKLYSPLIKRELDPLNQIMVSTGAYEALFCCILGHVSEGDEVILMEPFFDCYDVMVRATGGKPIFIPLKPTKNSGKVMSGDWKYDKSELESLFNEKTKAIIINTPHNPLGKVFTRDELEHIANLCKKWDVLCIADEVYEWIVYEPYEHVRIATLPDMFERTITICSAGKTFSVTGWKTGWAYGPAALMRNLFVVHQNCVNSNNTPTQEAVAVALEIDLARFGQPECYMKKIVEELQPKRDYLTKCLTDVGMVPTIPEGGYFMMADWSPLENKADLNTETDKYKDYRFAKWCTKNIKLLGIPPTAFYGEEHKYLGENFIRYCFIKKDESLEATNKVLKNWVGIKKN